MDIQTFAYTTLGSIIAVVFPVLRGFVTSEFAVKEAGIPDWVKKYVGLAIFGMISALIVLAIFFATNPDATAVPWHTALLLGFGAESAIEKLRTSPK